ncbi:MAG: glycerol-3-phosphate dehydrogenase/oxidase [Anaerolineales bacterium]|nr:glycerol-3-phosphate dehydrogenase/oxidase [Anaerolineales bacterium]
MNHTNWREKVWTKIHQPWDILIIGGGITGAGILREATRIGLRALLVEQNDFSSGTSSRSSKLVHGGLRYLKEGKLTLTQASVHEREQLLHEGPGLIDPLGFLLTIYKGDFPGRWTFEVGLTVYDLLALRWDHRHYSPQDFRMLAPHIAQHNLEGGFRYGDAQTDDARLVYRIIREAILDGGSALNYAKATELIFEDSKVVGARIRDQVGLRQADVTARVVINATGAWADQLRTQVGALPRIRPLRGSHLIFPAWRLPVAQAISFLHPLDRRPVFIFPWEGITLVGTTDLDHHDPLEEEPSISPHEVSYLMAAVEAQFPSLSITLEDVISTFSGVRPVIGSGKDDPSKESRDHIVWNEDGLLTVTGGKLTTFRLIALDVLKAARSRLPDLPEIDQNLSVLNQVNIDLSNIPELEDQQRRRILGRHAADTLAFLQSAQAGELQPIQDTPTLWAELRWACRMEYVVHLDDLLLRRTRLGLQLPQGGQALFPVLKSICQAELRWTDQHWDNEANRYRTLWEQHYQLPQRNAIPEWKPLLETARARHRAMVPRSRKLVRRTAIAGLVIAAAAAILYWKKKVDKRHIDG